jgi:hypothetical protein
VNVSDIVVQEQEVNRVLLRYCRGVDRMDAELTLSCFHTDATAHYGTLYQGSAAGFVEWLWPIHASMIGHVHTLSNVLVEFDDDRTAASESYVHTQLRVREADGSKWDLLGRSRYLDRWERASRTWKIRHRALVNDLRSAVPVTTIDTATHIPPAGTSNAPIASRRDHDDPSYSVLADGRARRSR